MSLSFGNQGAAQAQNIRDSGIPNEKIIVANRADAYAEDAKARGFIVEHDFSKAAAVADGTYFCFRSYRDLTISTSSSAVSSDT